jgi:hypothetical protein
MGTKGDAMQHEETDHKTTGGKPAAIFKMAQDEAEHPVVTHSDLDERKKARGTSIEKWLFLAMFSWLVVLLVCNGTATPTNSQLVGFAIYTGSPIVAAILAGVAAHYYPLSRHFLKWLAAIVLVATTYLAFMVYSDATYHGFSMLQNAAASPTFWLFLDLVVLSVLYLLAPEKAWRQNRRSVSVVLVLLLAISLGGYFLSLSGKGAMRLPFGYDIVAQIKAGNIPSENVPDFVLNGTDTYTIDFSGTVTIDYVGNTRTIYADTTLPVPAPKRVTVELYLCQPLSSRATKLADGTIAYGGTGYPQLVNGRSYVVTGVLEKAWQVSPRVFVPGPANIREK